MNVDFVLNAFVEDYGFNNITDLRQLSDVDIMENVIDLGERLSNLDTPDIDDAMAIIHRLKEYEILQEYIHKL